MGSRFPVDCDAFMRHAENFWIGSAFAGEAHQLVTENLMVPVIFPPRSSTIISCAAANTGRLIASGTWLTGSTHLSSGSRDPLAGPPLDPIRVGSARV
jgi:hypothetical protein